MEEVHLCTERSLPEHLEALAIQKAIDENPNNLPTAAAMADPAASADTGALPTPSRLALPIQKMWKPGRTLRIRFRGGSATLQARVQGFAEQWTEHANIKFVFDNAADDAEIRISFTPNIGSWSYLGTDNLLIDDPNPTMNFGWFTDSTPDDEVRRTTIHEFGHALGCIHEHQSPGGQIPWDKPKVYAYYAGPPNNWDKAKVDSNLFAKYDMTTTQFSAFDPDSIMLYAIPNSLTIGDFETTSNSELSDTDKAFIREVYPGAEETWGGWETLGGVITSDPAVTSWGSDRLDVFARGTDDALWHRWWDGHSWGGWESLGGIITTEPTVASWGPDRLDVFARGTDNALWHRWWDGSSWGGWESLSGIITTEPVPVSSGPDHIDVFARGTDQALWYRRWNGQQWESWRTLGGVITTSPTASSWGPNRVDVFARGTDNALWHRWQG